MNKAVIIIADGSEEMEVVITVDLLRRANMHVDIISISCSKTKCSRDVTLLPDQTLDAVDIESYDLLILPGGGPGTDALKADNRVLSAVQAFVAAQKLVCAICAAPLVLQEAGVLDGRRVTCHPAVVDELTVCECVSQRVVRDGNILTSQGPGTAFDFALEIIRIVKGEAAASQVRNGLVLD